MSFHQASRTLEQLWRRSETPRVARASRTRFRNARNPSHQRTCVPPERLPALQPKSRSSGLVSESTHVFMAAAAARKRRRRVRTIHKSAGSDFARPLPKLASVTYLWWTAPSKARIRCFYASYKAESFWLTRSKVYLRQLLSLATWFLWSFHATRTDCALSYKSLVIFRRV